MACDVNTHCLGRNRFLFNGHGGSAYVAVNPFSNADTCISFIAAPIWVSTSYSNFFYFVEQGIMRGTSPPYNGGCLGLHWYWVDSRVCCGIDIHHTSLATSLNTTYQPKITWSGNGNWGLYRDGTYFASSINNGCCSDILQAGVEVASSAVVAIDGAYGTFQKKTLSDTWNYQWPGTITADSPVTAGWNSYGESMWFHETQ